MRGLLIHTPYPPAPHLPKVLAQSPNRSSANLPTFTNFLVS